MSPDPDERRLRDAIGALADHYEATALDEQQVVAELERSLKRRPAARLALTVIAAAVLTLAALGLPALLGQPRVGAPSFPPVAGIFVTQTPDAAGRCFAVRIYDTTARDGRVALWTWEGADGCARRASSLLLSVGSASAVAIGDEDGILVQAAQSASDGLAGFSRVLVLAPDGESLRGHPTRADAEAERSGTTWSGVPQLDIPYRP